jgi:phosphoglycerate dehydrogenase-like enzyme
MIQDNFNENFLPLKKEMFQMCLTSYSYVEKGNNFEYRYKNSSRYFLLEKLTSLRALSNVIIMHLCKFDEDKFNTSFIATKNLLNKQDFQMMKIGI